jgi:hypothetical protein
MHNKQGGRGGRGVGELGGRRGATAPPVPEILANGGGVCHQRVALGQREPMSCRGRRAPGDSGARRGRGTSVARRPRPRVASDDGPHPDGPGASSRRRWWGWRPELRGEAGEAVGQAPAGKWRGGGGTWRHAHSPTNSLPHPPLTRTLSLSLSLALALALSVGIGIGIGVCVCVSCVSSCVPSCVPSCVRVRADHDDEPWPSPRFRHRVDSRAERVVSLPCFPSSGRCGGSCLCRDQPAVFRD